MQGGVSESDLVFVSSCLTSFSLQLTFCCCFVEKYFQFSITNCPREVYRIRNQISNSLRYLSILKLTKAPASFAMTKSK
jgi:hypothetical protein